MKTMKYNEQDSESGQSDIVTSKTSTKILQNFMTCASVLIQHVENVLSKCSGLLRVDNSSTITTNNDSDIDIVEHCIKQEPNEVYRYLNSIKKCLLQISLLCVQHNIYVNYDYTSNTIEYYSYLDDSTRGLVINYLSENIVYLIEHIGFIISNFKEDKGREDLKEIKKSLLKIYKQVILIPLNQNLDVTSTCFQDLNQSQWYAESILNLEEKLALLRTALIKFKKTIKKNILNSQYATKNKKNKSNSLEELDKKDIDHVFLIPDIPLNKSDEDAVEKRKKKKQSKIDNLILSDNESSTQTECKNIEEGVKKKNKKRKHDDILIVSESEIEKDKNFNELNTFVESDKGNKKKHKHKIKSQNSENGSDEINDAESIISVECNKDNGECEFKSLYKNSKDTLNSKHSKNENLEMKQNREIDDGLIISVKSKKENKRKKEHNENECNTKYNSVQIKKRKKHKHDLIQTEHVSNTMESYKNSSENKDISLNETQSPSKNNKSKNDSECSVASLANLFTSHIEIGDDELSLHDNENNNDDYEELDASIETDKNKSDISHVVFGKYLVEDMSERESEKFLEEILKQSNLSENERFLYIQELLHEARETKEISEDQKQKLQTLCIMIDWDLPAAHQIQSRLCLGPQPHELATLKELGVTFKKYNLEEDNIIRKNWKNFCKYHDLNNNPAPFLKFRHGRKVNLKYEERKKFIQYLGKGLPNRALYSIYKRFKILFRTEKTGRFSPIEDQLILIYCNKTNIERKFAELAHVLNRTRPSIEQRYRVLKTQNNDRLKWTLDLETDLVQKLLKAVGLDDVSELKDAKIKKDHYKKVANEMQIPWSKIKTQWLKLIYTKLFAEEVLHNGKIRTKIISLILEQNVTDWKKLNWDKILSHFKGMTIGFLWHHLTQAQLKVVPKIYHKDLGKALEYLKNYINEENNMNNIPFSKKITQRYMMSENGLVTYI